METKVLQNTIRDLLFRQGRKHKELCDAIGISDAGMRKIYARNSCELSTLRKIAAFFNVPISEFFEEEDVHLVVRDNEESFNTNDSKTLEDLTNIIKSQQERIDYLTDLLLKKA